MEEELKHLIDSEWQWRVKQISVNEYLTTFPNKKTLNAFSRSFGFSMAVYNITATVTPSDLDPNIFSSLQSGWVQMFNVPDEARSVEAVTLIAEKAGEVIAVDEVSLIKVGPVGAKIRSRDLTKIQGYLEIFINGEGTDIKFVPELGKRKPGNGGKPPPSYKPDNDKFNDEDEDHLFEDEEDPMKKARETERDSSLNPKHLKNSSGSGSKKHEGGGQGAV
jgi:hypothetical protein